MIGLCSASCSWTVHKKPTSNVSSACATCPSAPPIQWPHRDVPAQELWSAWREIAFDAAPDAFTGHEAVYSNRLTAKIPIRALLPELLSDSSVSINIAPPHRLHNIGKVTVRWFGNDYPDNLDRFGVHPYTGNFYGYKLCHAFQVLSWGASAPTAPTPERASEHTQASLSEFEAFCRSSARVHQSFAVLTHPQYDESANLGVAIVLLPAGGTEYIMSFVLDLVQSGWLVVLQLRSTLPIKDFIGPKESAAYFNELAIKRPDEFARRADEMLADQAYIVEAALAHTRRMFPRVPNKAVLVGVSFGALVGVPSVAKNPAAFDAAVFIAGGTQLGTVVAGSGLLHVPKNDSDNLARHPMLTPSQLVQLEQDYLAFSRLDAYHTAPLLRGVPTLLIDAANDGVVPPRFADQLWDRLGNPERWTINAGHSYLIYTLDNYSSDVVSWINHTTKPFQIQHILEHSTPNSADDSAANAAPPSTIAP